VEGNLVTDKLNVVVCDDDDDRAADWAERIEESVGGQVTATPLESGVFGAAVAALKERKAKAKQDGGSLEDDDPALVIDGADVLVLDSDLTPDAGSSHGSDPSEMVAKHLVGELGGEVAHLARCYSNARALVVVNQKWKRRSFDLTLQVFRNDVAEVYVSETDIDNPGLWGLPGDENFRPWAWPVLGAVPWQLEELIASVSLDQPVLETLGLDAELVARNLTDRQLDALGIEDWGSMRFVDVARASNFGLRLKEDVDEGHQLRVAVCGVRRWLDRHVLPSHNVLIDLPHLQQRRPWAVEARDDLASWNRPETWFTGQGPTPPASDPAPHAYASVASRWLGRHVWLWPTASQDPRSREERVLPSDPVFCEDTSTFVAADDATDFVSDLEGPSGQRFIRSLSDVDYHPRRRLLLT
jgi:hypothetical protein